MIKSVDRAEVVYNTNREYVKFSEDDTTKKSKLYIYFPLNKEEMEVLGVNIQGTAIRVEVTVLC